MVTAGGWPVTKLNFKYQEREAFQAAFIPRDLSHVSHELVKVKERVKELNTEGYSSSHANVPKADTAKNKSNLLEEEDISITW